MNRNRVLAIGDIHGSTAALRGLLDAVYPTQNDKLVLLGDYVDRGPDSAGTLEIVRKALKRLPVIALRGNHEQMMRGARYSNSALQSWLMNGGVTTLESFGLPPTAEGVKAVPQAVWDLLDYQLVDFHEGTQHLYVHAGAEPHLPLHLQDGRALQWMEFGDIQPHQSGKRIVCGHTAGHQVRVEPHKICLDTYMGKMPDGLLSAMDLNSGKVWQVDAQGRPARR